MHKTIIIFFSLAVVGINCAFAQNERVKPKPTEFAEYKMTTENDTAYFYLYNPDADKFWPIDYYPYRNSIGANAHASWVAFVKHEPEKGTRWDGAVNMIYYNSAIQSIRVKQLDGGDDYMPEEPGVDASSLILKHNTDGSFRIMASQRNMQSWITRNQNANWCLDITDNGSMRGPNWYDTTRWTDENHYCTNWRLVAPEVYKSMEKDLECYYGAEVIYTLIEKTEAKHPRINLTRAKAVYADMESTIEQMDEVKRLIDCAVELSEFINLSEQQYPMLDSLTAINLLTTDTYTSDDIERVTHNMIVEQRQYEVALLLDGTTERFPRNIAPLWPDAYKAGASQCWMANTPYSSIRSQNETNKYGVIENTIYSLYVDKTSQHVSDYFPDANYVLPDCNIYRSIAYLPRGHYRFIANVELGSKSTGGPSGVYMFARCSDYEQCISATSDNGIICLDFYSPGADTVTVGFKLDRSNISNIQFDKVEIWYYGDVEGNPSDIERQYIISNYAARYTNRMQIMADANLIDAYYNALDALNTADDFASHYDNMVSAARELEYSINCYKILQYMVTVCEQKRDEFADNDIELSEKLGDLTMILDKIYADGADLNLAIYQELGIGLWNIRAYIDQIIANTTDILYIDNISPTRHTIYNLMGIKRLAPQRGINIIKGKKVLIY